MSESAAPRLAPVPPDEWGEEMRTALANAFSDGVASRLMSADPDSPPMPNALATMMHNPALTGPFLVYNNVLLQTPALGHRTREILVLRVAWRTRSRYEWLQHVRLAARLGITEAEIIAVTDGAGAASWSPFEADLIAATDQLIDGYRVEDATWARLAEHLDEAQLVELVFTVGTYTGLAMAFNSFGLQLDPDLQEIATTSLPKFEE